MNNLNNKKMTGNMTEDEFIEAAEDLRLLAQLFEFDNTQPLEGFARERVATVVRRIGTRLIANIPDKGALRTEIFNYQENWLCHLRIADRPTTIPEHRLYRF